jgi:hypothetical protein
MTVQLWSNLDDPQHPTCRAATTLTPVVSTNTTAYAFQADGAYSNALDYTPHSAVSIFHAKMPLLCVPFLCLSCRKRWRPSEPEEIPLIAKTDEQVNLDNYYFSNPHPNLSTHDPPLDSHENTTHEPTKENTIYEPTKENPHGGKGTARNETPVFKATRQAKAAESGEQDSEAKEVSMDDEGYSVLNHLQLSRTEMANLHYYPLFTR